MNKRILIVGYGAIGQAISPLILRHLDVAVEDVFILTADDRGEDIANEYGFHHRICPLTPSNYRWELSCILSRGDILINVSVGVSSHDLLKWCQEKGVLYLDTCVEPWEGGYTNADIDKTTNHYLREQVLGLHFPHGGWNGSNTTALIAHGANPGLVSYFVSKGLKELAVGLGIDPEGMSSGQLAQKIGVHTIQIAERDTQDNGGPSLDDGEFRNTWSVSYTHLTLPTKA